jgi:hypothetical protein
MGMGVVMRTVIRKIVSIDDSENEFPSIKGCQSKKEFLRYHGLSQDGKGRYYCKFVNQSSAIRGYVDDGIFVSTFTEDPLRPMDERASMVKQHNFMYRQYVEGIIK